MQSENVLVIRVAHLSANLEPQRLEQEMAVLIQKTDVGRGNSTIGQSLSGDE